MTVFASLQKRWNDFSLAKIRLVRKLQAQFLIEYSTDEIHPQQVSFSSISVPFAHNFERFDSGIYIFNDNAFL